MPNARPARSGLATTSRRRAHPASGGVRRSRPLAQQAWEQVLSQTEGVLSFRHGMLRARGRHGRRSRDNCSGGAFDAVCGASRHPCGPCVAALATSTGPTPRERNVGQHAPFRQAHRRAYATLAAGMLPQCIPMAHVLGNPPWVASMWRRSHLVCMPSKNFLGVGKAQCHFSDRLIPWSHYGGLAHKQTCIQNQQCP
jgi:hypothetical protein